jgi:hypothetical protein
VISIPPFLGPEEEFVSRGGPPIIATARRKRPNS